MVTGININITQNSQSAADNSSNVTVDLVINWNGGSYNATGNAPGTLTIDGTAYDFKAVFNKDQKTSGSEVFYSETVDVPHNDNGSKTLVCEASFDTQTMAGTVTAATTKTLTQIARESTLSAAPADIGATSAITVDRKNAAYTHSVAYRFGSLSGYLASAGGRLSASEVKLSGTSIRFPVPESFYTQIPNAPSGDCTLTIRTYSGSTQIGSARICTFRVTAEKEACKPVVSGTVVDINEATLALTGDKNKLVLGMSTALCTMTARARNSASLKSRTIGGVTVSGNSRTIRNMALAQVVFTATDSRGYPGSDMKAVNLIKYIRLTGNVTAKRTDPTSGNVKLAVDGKYFNGSFGAAENSLTLRYSVDGGEYVTVEPQIGDGEYTAAADLSGLDYQSTHSITVEIKDKLETVTKTVTVGKGIPVFDWGEKDFAFHVPVTMNGQKVTDIAAPEKETDAANKDYVDKTAANQEVKSHTHGTGDTTSGVFSTDRLPTVPVSKGGTGAAAAEEARANLGIGAAALYTGALSSGTAGFSGSYKLYIILGRTGSSNSLVSLVLPAAACDGSTKYQLYADEQYINFTVSTGGLTIGTASGGAVTAIYGVN